MVDARTPAPVPSPFEVEDPAVVGPTELPETTTPVPSTPLPAASPGAPAPNRAPVRVGDRLTIPAINAGWRVERKPIRNGELVLPSDVGEATLWKGSKTPGTGGVVLLASHVRNGGVWGPARDVNKLVAGNIATLRVDGKVTRWKLTRIVSVPKDQLPAGIWATGGPSKLVFVTCGGKVQSDGHYDQNVVLTFVPVG